ncbi:FeoC-like transcriptional regulator [Actinoallomurus spadix]|uniref:Transcriptional regulator n=1 Tax=Actinoallomurus spadix TaxID=79912 RepID=A0ABN0W490_9ACTN|nr:FeoC-like transcriptional regulator [Actinoallomurus spadix]MCO5985628.1 FeoC-like transcriptional regulator [Actinoallomurus spadix]
MAGQDGLRASAARDRDFVGIDTAAMARLIQQMTSASNAITAWLRTNAALPAGVPRTGLHQAAAVESWARAQPGMLSRRRSYAIAHLSKGAADMPKAGTGRLGAHPGGTTAAGAGHAVGHFPDAHAATRAGTTDATAINAALTADHPIPAAVWKRLAADSGDPDYVKGLYARLGPAGTAGLIEAALGHEARLAAVRESLGLASHHLRMSETWLRGLLEEATRKGVHDEAVSVLEHAGLDRRAKVALAHVGLTHLGAAPPGHRVPAPNPPHEAMLRPAAADPEAVAELHARHSDAVRRALAACPASTVLQRLGALQGERLDGTARVVTPPAKEGP